MTRDEIMKLEMSSETDLLIARTFKLLPQEILDNNGFEEQGSWMVGVLPSYSSDTRDAMKVVSAMWHQPENVYDAFLEYVTQNCPKSNNTPAKVIGWWLAISGRPLAICRAALLAVMDK